MYTVLPLSNYIYGVSFFKYEMQTVCHKSVFMVSLMKTFASYLKLPVQDHIPLYVSKLCDSWTQKATMIIPYLLTECWQQFLFLTCVFIVQWLSSFKRSNIFNI